jgi:hypothetical protein
MNCPQLHKNGLTTTGLLMEGQCAHYLYWALGLSQASYFTSAYKPKWPKFLSSPESQNPAPILIIRVAYELCSSRYNGYHERKASA